MLKHIEEFINKVFITNTCSIIICTDVSCNSASNIIPHQHNFRNIGQRDDNLDSWKSQIKHN